LLGIVLIIVVVVVVVAVVMMSPLYGAYMERDRCLKR